LTMRPLETMQPATGTPLDNSKNLPHFRRANDAFLDVRFKQSGHRFLHLINQLVNDRVKLDLHAFMFRLSAAVLSSRA